MLTIIERRNADLKGSVKVGGKVGGAPEDSLPVKDVVVDKDFSYPYMPFEVGDAKLAMPECIMLE